jgi:LysM repeat protein
MHKLLPMMAITLAASTSFLQAQDSAAPACKSPVMVERGDTLSAIAERCDISEARILAANPRIEGSSDLVIGQRIAIDAPGKQVGNRLWDDLKSAAGQTRNALESIAKDVNSSAQEILDKNPDLRARVDGLGKTLGLTGGTSSGSVGVVGAASESVAQARTAADGSLRQTTPLPSWLPSGKRAVVTILDDRQTVLARSAAFSHE